MEGKVPDVGVIAMSQSHIPDDTMWFFMIAALSLVFGCATLSRKDAPKHDHGCEELRAEVESLKAQLALAAATPHEDDPITQPTCDELEVDTD